MANTILTYDGGGPSSGAASPSDVRSYAVSYLNSTFGGSYDLTSITPVSTSSRGPVAYQATYRYRAPNGSWRNGSAQFTWSGGRWAVKYTDGQQPAPEDVAQNELQEEIASSVVSATAAEIQAAISPITSYMQENTLPVTMSQVELNARYNSAWENLHRLGFSDSRALDEMNRVIVGFNIFQQQEQGGRFQLTELNLLPAQSQGYAPGGIPDGAGPIPEGLGSISFGWIPKQAALILDEGAPLEDALSQANDFFNFGSGGGGSGGGGGGGGGGSFVQTYPGYLYSRPDVTLVQDWIKGQLQTLVGHVDPNRVDYLTDLYMSGHREDFNKSTDISRQRRDNEDPDAVFESQTVDPRSIVMNQIRMSADYKMIHAARPEDMDETAWLPDFLANVRGQGVETGKTLDRAIVNAQMGQLGVSQDEFRTVEEGRPTPAFFNKMNQAASVVAGALK